MSTPWRLARSLEVLRDEINALAPGRSTASDGTIGDDAHQSSSSDHNPQGDGVVCAADFTHDPDSGADMNVISRAIVAERPRALKYVIWDRQIWSVARASEGWRAYHGANPHTAHMHVSVGVGPDGHSTGPYDDTSPWGLATLEGGDMIGLRRGDEGERVKALQATLAYAGFDPGQADGDYGPKTAAAVLAMRRSQGSEVDDGDHFTGWAYAQLMMAMAKRYGGEGKTGPRGPAGPAGKDGRDGVLELPVGVEITGRITKAGP